MVVLRKRPVYGRNIKSSRKKIVMDFPKMLQIATIQMNGIHGPLSDLMQFGH